VSAGNVVSDRNGSMHDPMEVADRLDGLADSLGVRGEELHDYADVVRTLALRGAGPVMATAQQQLDALHAEQKRIDERLAALYAASVSAPAEEKVCEDWVAEMLGEPQGRMKYPITVHGITYSERDLVEYTRSTVGRYVAVRPCDDALGGKTFLGVYLGDIALSTMVQFHPKTGVIEAGHFMHNPAIWVPDLKRIVFGAQSWWGVLKTPNDMKQITDADIQNVWYVQAMRAMDEAAAPPARTDE
jgi:hypothetical protein